MKDEGSCLSRFDYSDKIHCENVSMLGSAPIQFHGQAKHVSMCLSQPASSPFVFLTFNSLSSLPLEFPSFSTFSILGALLGLFHLPRRAVFQFESLLDVLDVGTVADNLRRGCILA